MPRPCRNFHIHSRLRPLIRQRAKIMQCKRELARRMWLCTNRFGCAVKSGRADDRRCRDSGYEKRVPLVGDGRLGAQRHLVNRAGDPMPVITGDPEHAQIAHGYEDRGQSQAQDRVNGTVESGSQAPRVVAEVRRAATEARAVSAAARSFGNLTKDFVLFVRGLPRFLVSFIRMEKIGDLWRVLG